MTIRSAVIALLLLAPAVPGAGAQTVTGRLLESGTDQPVSTGTVALLTEEGALVRTTQSRGSGAFRLSVGADTVGAYLLTAQALGYRNATDGPFRLGPSDSISVDFRIPPHPVVLESLLVRAGQAEVTGEIDLVRNGFVDRMRGGLGKFITPGDLERMNPPHLAGLFGRVQGVNIRYGFGQDRLRMRGSRGWCIPRVYVDGFHRTAGGFLDNLGLAVPDIEAVEVFRRPAEAPLEYGGGRMEGCGIILIWTKP